MRAGLRVRSCARSGFGCRELGVARRRCEQKAYSEEVFQTVIVSLLSRQRRGGEGMVEE